MQSLVAAHEGLYAQVVQIKGDTVGVRFASDQVCAQHYSVRTD
jgi:hypothetical protein